MSIYRLVGRTTYLKWFLKSRTFFLLFVCFTDWHWYILPIISNGIPSNCDHDPTCYLRVLPSCLSKLYTFCRSGILLYFRDAKFQTYKSITEVQIDCKLSSTKFHKQKLLIWPSWNERKKMINKKIVNISVGYIIYLKVKSRKKQT